MLKNTSIMKLMNIFKNHTLTLIAVGRLIGQSEGGGCRNGLCHSWVRECMGAVVRVVGCCSVALRLVAVQRHAAATVAVLPK